ncbi:thioesterase domain-containing protein [Nostoc sp. CMAA1605]|uniref:thioesterase domain-containing protein n=1 Tax=Nostoc sp. CMAA1605 TaxID=2055159 RepID=UPI001F48174D|nr:thioesterase domain-containing protein [Nostoc sp. CMAA1605]MCF4968773.1 hypothetical protein [Nostoc sp. CMAA1605]
MLIKNDQDISTTESNKIQPWLSLVAIQPHGSRPPLFCVHSVGISVLHYHKLALYLGSEQPFYALQPQGADGIKTPFNQIEAMAYHYVKEIQTVQTKGPYFLGGSSFGGRVVWEMAQQLVMQGQEVAFLALFDSAATDIRRTPLDKRISHHWDHFLQQGLSFIITKIYGKIQLFKMMLKTLFKTLLDKKLKQIIVKFYLLNKYPLPYSLRSLFVEESHREAGRTYVIQPYQGKVTLFKASDRHLPEGCEIDFDLGWSKLALGGLDIQDIPGNHNSIFQEPHVQVLAEKMKTCMDNIAILNDS